MEPAKKTVGTVVSERRMHTRFHMLMCVDITVAGRSDIYWGSLNNLSRTGVAMHIRQHLKKNQKVTVRFRFLSAEGQETTEVLIAKVVWQCGDNAGLEFDPPLTAGSTALQKAPQLVAHLAEKEAGADHCKDTGATGGVPSQC